MIQVRFCVITCPPGRLNLAKIRKWIMILGLALVVDLLLIILVGRQVVSIFHPAPIRETTPLFYQPNATALPGCMPYHAAGKGQFPIGEGSGASVATSSADNPIRPSITPLPVINKVDLAPSSPNDQKSTVMVFLCSGKFQEYLLGSDQDLSTIPLYEGDMILLIVPPSPTMGPGSQ